MHFGNAGRMFLWSMIKCHLDENDEAAIWSLKMSVVKIPDKQDIRITWWELLVELSISRVVAGAIDLQGLMTYACRVEVVGSRGQELDLEVLSAWSINLEWIVFTNSG